MFYKRSSYTQAGGVFFAMFAAVGMVGVLAASSVTLIKGPVRTMHVVTQRTIAENNIIASSKLAIIMSERDPGDCDGDGAIEPVEWGDAGANPSPINGGLLPPSLGASLQDPWGNHYGYCVWDHGDFVQDDTCGMSAKRLRGNAAMSNMVLAVISSGPDKIFQTICNHEGDGDYLHRPSESDDIVLGYTYAEASVLAGGLWRIKEDDPKTAEIQKNLLVKDESGAEQLSFDIATQHLELASGGTGALPNVKTDFVQPLSGSAVEFLSNIKMSGAWLSGDGSNKGLQIENSGNLMANAKLNVTNATANDIGIEALASGLNSIGVKAGGTSKAIEANGIIDMTSNKIVNLATPTQDYDGATKKYVDDKMTAVKKHKCDSFSFNTCSSGATTNLATTSLGDCKRACENAGVRCCSAIFGNSSKNPNATLAHCVGYTTGVANVFVIDILSGLLNPLNVAAVCYEQY
jgi:hypothetical protein